MIWTKVFWLSFFGYWPNLYVVLATITDHTRIAKESFLILFIFTLVYFGPYNSPWTLCTKDTPERWIETRQAFTNDRPKSYTQKVTGRRRTLVESVLENHGNEDLSSVHTAHDIGRCRTMSSGVVRCRCNRTHWFNGAVHIGLYCTM